MLLVSGKKNFQFAWKREKFLWLNHIHYQHVMKPQLISGIEGHHVCQQKDLVNENFCLVSERNATYTTMHAKWDYMIRSLLQALGEWHLQHGKTVDSRHPTLIASTSLHSISRAWLTGYIITGQRNGSMLGPILADFRHPICVLQIKILLKRLTRVPASCFLVVDSHFQ